MRNLYITGFFLLSFAFSPNVHAQERYTTVKIVPERTHVKGGEELRIATEISLAKDWHVYWLNPGDSGIPVKITWKTPEKFEIKEINWPTPDKISYDILLNYGYYDRVTLLQDLKVPDKIPEGKITLDATVEMLVCNEICIPETSTISIDFNDPALTPQDNKDFIAAASDKLPEELTGTFTYSDVDKKLHVRLAFDDSVFPTSHPVEKFDFFPKALGIINHVSKPEVTVDYNEIMIRYERGDQPTDALDPLEGLLVITGEHGQNIGYDISIKRDQNQTPSAQKKTEPPKLSTDHVTLMTAFLFAFLGGLILNLMPCVFPVLSMKALSLVKMSDKELDLARKHGLAYTAGVMLSFISIGGILLALKSTGSAIGWGFQLQNPIVVALLTYMLFMIGLNLMGFFEVGTRLGNLGDKLTRKSGLGGSFFTGVLATVVATPCTAPFMGAAMGFALVQPAAIGIGIFAALGFGLALPYLYLSYVPSARRILPKPGAWMNSFKQFLAFPMFASAIWLTWVIALQSGVFSILIVMGSMLLLSMGVWLSHKKGHLAHIFMFVCIFLPLIGLAALIPMPKAQEFGSPFTNAALEEALASPEPVFVEMTAAWCITCKINHATSLNTESTKNLFKEKNIRYLIGDWTNYNAEITEFLNRYERDGVPIYVYYGKPDAKSGERPEPKILPQVLTPAIVKEYVGQ